MTDNFRDRGNDSFLAFLNDFPVDHNESMIMNIDRSLFDSTSSLLGAAEGIYETTVNRSEAAIVMSPQSYCRTNSRLISNDDIAHMPGPGGYKTLTSTPTENIKSLIQLKAAVKRERSFTFIPAPLAKKLKSEAITSAEADSSLLHKACCNPKVTAKEIDALLRTDPSAASKPARIMTRKGVYNAVFKKVVQQTTAEQYKFPLNLAISHGANDEVIEMLIDAAPSVLTAQDGTQRETPLAVLIKHSPRNVNLVDKILLMKPRCASLLDRHSNTPMHIACTRGAALEVCRHIGIISPESHLARNFHNRTPLELAQQHVNGCSEEVYNYLWNNATH